MLSKKIGSCVRSDCFTGWRTIFSSRPRPESIPYLSQLARIRFSFTFAIIERRVELNAVSSRGNRLFLFCPGLRWAMQHSPLFTEASLEMFDLLNRYAGENAWQTTFEKRKRCGSLISNDKPHYHRARCGGRQEKKNPASLGSNWDDIFFFGRSTFCLPFGLKAQTHNAGGKQMPENRAIGVMLLKCARLVLCLSVFIAPDIR